MEGEGEEEHESHNCKLYLISEEGEQESPNQNFQEETPEEEGP